MAGANTRLWMFKVCVLAVVFLDVGMCQQRNPYLLSEAGAQKPGACGPLARLVCHNTCFSDSECLGNDKCCETACGGTVCSRPITARANDYYKEKPGACPSDLRGTAWHCSSTCQYDTDCRRNMKCCRNRCNAKACMAPQRNNDNNF